jgi:hypothetical protein
MCEKIFTEYEYIDSIKYIQTQEIYIFGNHARVLNLKIYQFQISFVRPSGYRYMVCLANSSYSFRATVLILCGMFIHIMEVCMSTGFWFSSNILKSGGIKNTIGTEEY